MQQFVNRSFSKTPNLGIPSPTPKLRGGDEGSGLRAQLHRKVRKILRKNFVERGGCYII